MATVEVRNVRKAFGPVEVLHGVSVDIADGEFVVLVGPSGCGKSTLLRMLAGLENITSGEIAIGGRVVNSVPPKDRDIAMVFQNYALYPHMTVYDNMAFSLTLAKAPKTLMDEEVGRAAKILGLEQLLQRFPRQLSGGQRQRVAMGRAIVRNPQVFLFDEPLSNLDAKLRVQMRSEIKELHQRLKVTTVYVTHDQIEAMTMATRIAVMPPSESPTRWHEAISSLSSSAIRSSARSSIVAAPSGTGERPWPLVSYRTTRKCFSSSGSWASHIRRSEPSEFDSTTVGPSGCPVTTASTVTALIGSPRRPPRALVRRRCTSSPGRSARRGASPRGPRWPGYGHRWPRSDARAISRTRSG